MNILKQPGLDGMHFPMSGSDAMLLNLGCGRHTHPDWVNIDLNAQATGVRVHDLRQGIPFGNDSFDVVYHSHLLEHLSQDEAARLVGECLRVLRPRGILRVVVPDLERIARLYLAALNDLRAGDVSARGRHQWMSLELIDQLSRHRSGGEVAAFLSTATETHRRIALERWGEEVQDLRESGADAQSTGERWSACQLWTWTWPGCWLRTVRSFIGGERWRIGDFRLSGEVHLWMYDAVSLERRLRDSGFVDVRSVSATESRIRRWLEFQLDAAGDGLPRKPDSLYMEAVKPVRDPS